jgi:hypothetical protein
MEEKKKKISLHMLQNATRVTLLGSPYCEESNVTIKDFIRPLETASYAI